MSWERGRTDIERLIADGELERVTPSAHIAVIDAVKAQFNDRGGMKVFGRLHALRRRRNRTEYPDLDSPGVNADDVRQALDTARATVDAAKRLLNSGRLDPFDEAETLTRRARTRPLAPPPGRARSRCA